MITTANECNMKWMASKDSGYYDLVDADPPYFSGPEKRKFYGSSINKLKIKRVDYPVTETWDLPDLNWFNEVKRVGKNWIIWGANYFDFIGEPFKTPRRYELNDWLAQNPKGWIVWDKCNGDSSFNDFELAFTSFDKPTVIFKFMWNGMLQGKSLNEGHIMRGDKSKNQKRIHPTEKPIELYDWIYLNYTNEKSKVLNTHGGSLSCVLSAEKFNHAVYDCVELNKIHYDNAINRINQHKKQLVLL